MRYCTFMSDYFSRLADTQRLSSRLLTSLSRLSSAANYLSLILRDWSEKVAFLELQFARERRARKEPISSQFSLEDVEGALFDTIIDECDKVLKSALNGLSSAISRTFQINSQSYFNQKFVSPSLLPILINATRNKTEVAQSLAYDISPDMCTPLYELRENIREVCQELAPMLQKRFWSIFTEELDSAILSSILDGRARYTQNTAEHLHHNMKVLFSLIQPYLPANIVPFPRTRDCIRILILDKSDLHQLYTDLYMLNASEQKTILEEYRVGVLSGRETECLIQKRSDVALSSSHSRT